MSYSTNLITEELVNKGKTEEKLSNVISIENFSDYDKVIRVSCYVRRFIYNCKAIARKKNCLTGNVSFKEFKEAELLLLKEDQLIFKERKYEFIDLFNSLNLIEDSDGLLKVKGRLENSTLQLPILLNKDSHLTKLIIWRSHVQRFHSALKDTLNHLRQKYWVTRGRQTVKGVIKGCVICLKHNSKPFRSLPDPPLPHTQLILISRFPVLVLTI